MTTPSAPARTLPVREVTGLALLVGGLAGVLVAAFAVDWRIGLALVSAAAVAAGVVLATREV